MTSPHTGKDSMRKPRSCHHHVSSVTLSKRFCSGTWAFPGYAEAKNATNSTHMPCRSWSRVPVTAHRGPSQACSSPETLPTTTWQSRAWSRGVCGFRGRVPRPMTMPVVSTARRTSLTAILCYRSCGTLPLSILQATRLTCSSHRNTVSPAPRRPQTRSSYTCWTLVARTVRRANRTKAQSSVWLGMV
jgi:hypothetical protein